ncbi:MAG: T9SS type A sorting domain-containing protein, partial [Candidatus Neomarinimicrobiota bacterium]|nr:T9SS type A sorting domain-containing protein [Candidatus Neomarinimicrobiota bacterium]
YGRGIWDFDMSTDSVGVEETVAMADAFQLYQNYPNPFNPLTTISFNLSEDADVQLSVYDVLGREVAELVSGRVVSGFHEVVWDASEVASGVYIYKLTTQHSLLTKKMILIK